MANIINVTSFVDATGTKGTTAKALAINVSNIIAMSTLATPYLTTGVTNIVYNSPQNNYQGQVNLIVTEALADVVDAANAPLA